MPSEKILLQLQNMLLKAVLLGHALPGSSNPVRFPDLLFIKRQSVIFLLDKNLSGPILIEELSRPIHVLSEAALFQESLKSGDVTFLQFQSPEDSGDEVTLTLDARIATQDIHQQTLGLSTISVTFFQGADGWRLKEEPLYSAS